MAVDDDFDLDIEDGAKASSRDGTDTGPVGWRERLQHFLQSHRLFVVAAGFFILVIFSGLWFFRGHSDEPPAAQKISAQEKTEASSSPPAAPARQSSGSSVVYVPIKPEFILSVLNDPQIRFVMIEVVLVVSDDATAASVDGAMPLIKDALLSFFSQKETTILFAADQRDRLKEDALSRVQEALSEAHHDARILQVLFTNFVME